ncbi:Alpha/Beta hydrolase protein [Hygrophoropsis aurantiaca]|uniref:Alpha/Beta hydrolase protein n=1 Tax=Hygrophoropsis aurantiaca TaxID=72124 RepID=A0ACB8AJ58_9AGAM|nr:Alpha/Beta hydrolase protein [Hygrophoropsis aurantiaca]
MLISGTLQAFGFALFAVNTVVAIEPVVDLGYTSYQGYTDVSANITRWLGIRYAEPPVGKLRWKAPQPPPLVSGHQDGTQQPPECYQGPMGASTTNPLKGSKRAISSSEDCLFLSVYSPQHRVSGGLPVIVWIHGGGYVYGSSSLFDGADLIKNSNNGVVVVTVQYRLGLFGFLAGKAVKAGGALNAGLLDQHQALQWVQSHISKFGGDPSKVTIWGESAGAGSVLQHVVAHKGSTHPPLFRAAMTSSTFLPPQYNYNDPIPEKIYGEVVKGAKCNSHSDTLACLRVASVDTLQSLNTQISRAGFVGTFTFVPVVDGSFIAERPTITLSRGKVNGGALLSVTNTFEGTSFVSARNKMNISDYVSTLFPHFGPAQAEEAAKAYNGVGKNNLDKAIGAMGEAIFICPTYYLLNGFGQKHAWKGDFAISPGRHGEDIDYYFTSGSPAFRNTAFIQAFARSFLSFAISLDPNRKLSGSDIKPSWNPWKPGATEMWFGKTSQNKPDVKTVRTNQALQARCNYWHGVSAYTSQ